MITGPAAPSEIHPLALIRIQGDIASAFHAVTSSGCCVVQSHGPGQSRIPASLATVVPACLLIITHSNSKERLATCAGHGSLQVKNLPAMQETRINPWVGIP